MSNSYDEFHANKSERLKSFENTVKIIFDETLKNFGDCFQKAKTSGSVTHVQIFDNYGKYYFKKAYRRFKGVLRQFDINGRHLENFNFNTRYILFRTVLLKTRKI